MTPKRPKDEDKDAVSAEAPLDAVPADAAEVGAGDDGHDAVYLNIKIYSPFRIYFEGRADSMSAESSTGPFDILPHHHNFITLLTPCDIIVRTGRGNQTIRIQGGIMHVKSDEITVFLDI